MTMETNLLDRLPAADDAVVCRCTSGERLGRRVGEFMVAGFGSGGAGVLLYLSSI